MPHNLKDSPVLLVGTGAMAYEYAKVLRALGQSFVTAGHSEARAATFRETWQVPTGSGPLASQLQALNFTPKAAIVASSAASLAEASRLLAQAGVMHLLIEKPAALCPDGALQLAKDLQASGASAYVAYNRRFYTSIQKARQIIEEDGGALSLKFDFSEARYRIEKAGKSKVDLEGWFYGNSTHVLDTAFYLAGRPKECLARSSGSLSWHPSGAVFTGCGTTEQGVPFSYHSNWIAPGRWGVEVMTCQRRLVLQPMEQLFVQDHTSFALREESLEDEIDKLYKPGLYAQVKAFLSDKENPAFLSMTEHAELFSLYAFIRDGGSIC